MLLASNMLCITWRCQLKQRTSKALGADTGKYMEGFMYNHAAREAENEGVASISLRLMCSGMLLENWFCYKFREKVPITCVGSQKHPVWTESETKAGLKGDVCTFKQNTDWQRDVWAPSAPEQHATTLSPLQQTVACVEGTGAWGLL